MGDFLVREGEMKFSKPIARAVLRDIRLSFGARGLFAFLWDLPARWRPNIKHLAGMGMEGKDAIRSRLRELEAVGAIRIEPIRNEADGTVAGRRWVIVAADRWAIEFPLRMTNAGIPEKRVFRESVEPIGGRSAHKVNHEQGYPKNEAASDRPNEEKNAAADFWKKTAKRRRKRASGIVTWCEDDDDMALRLESTFSLEEISSAIALATAANRSSVPGVVQEFLEKMQLKQRAAAEQQRLLAGVQAKFHDEISKSASAIAAGELVLEKIRHRKKRE